MGRAFIRYGAQLAIALAPLFTLQFSLLDWMNASKPEADGLIHFGVTGLAVVGTKDQVELKLALILTVVAVTFIAFSEAIDVYLPKQDLERFRREYLDQERKGWSKHLGPAVRINVMYAKRPWYALFLVRRLEWAWGYGYKPPHGHRDAQLGFWSGQGVCGRAFRHQRPLYADLRNFAPTGLATWLCNEFLLGPWKVAKTKPVKAVLSVPIFRQRGDKWTCVGVINLDATDEKSAQLLENNQVTLINYFSNLGIYIAMLRT